VLEYLSRAASRRAGGGLRAKMRRPCWREGLQRGMSTAETMVGETSVTQRLLGTAAARDSHVALLGGPADIPGACPGLSYPDLAVTLQRAAAGLAWRGVRPRDVVGVYVADALSYVLACHSIRAAGAVPSPVAPGLPVAEMAGQLADCGARMLITSGSLAAVGLAAADRSWVRQVISFGEAAGAMPFGSLLGLGSMRPAPVRAHDIALLPYLRRGDGALGPSAVTHLAAAAELLRLCAQAGLTEQDVVLAAPPSGDGSAYTALLDHVLLHGATVVAVPAGGDPAAEALAAAAREHQATAAIVSLGTEIAVSPGLRLLAVDG
jgi:non-ribosomal peptide synthetase component F